MTEFQNLILRARSGDKTARDLLVANNTGLVRSVVHRMNAKQTEQEDYFQIGMIGLLKAIDYFDISYNVQFSTYAVPMIMGEIRRYQRDDGILRISRSIKDNRIKISRAREKLTKELQREPKLSELSEETGLNQDEILLAVNAVHDVESLYQNVYEGDGTSICLMDKISANSDETSRNTDRLMLTTTLAALGAKERELIIRRFYMEQTQSEIAGEMGVSQVQVSRLEKKILKKMKAIIE